MGRSTIITLAAVLCAASVVACAEAQTDRRAMLRQIDSNGDGKLQFSELRAMRANVFARLDANGDGGVDLQEAQAAANAAQGRAKAFTNRALGGGMERIAALDLNDDGVVDYEEFVGHVPQRLIAADTNGDGALSRREMRSLRR